MPPFTVQRIDHVVLRVADLERSVDFYVRVLGLTVVRRRDELGLVHLRTGASMIDLVSLQGELGSKGGRGAGVEGRNVDHVCLRVEPYDERTILDFVAGNGLALAGRAVSNFGAEGNGPSVYISDPDGNLIELKGPPTSG